MSINHHLVFGPFLISDFVDYLCSLMVVVAISFEDGMFFGQKCFMLGRFFLTKNLHFSLILYVIYDVIMIEETHQQKIVMTAVAVV